MSIRKKVSANGKVTYQAVIERGYDETGNRIREYKTFQTKREAQVFCNKIKNDIHNGTYIEPSKMTVSQALDEWLETEVRPKLASATVESYERNVKNYLRPAFGSILLQQLSPMTVQGFYNKLDKEKNLSQRTIKYVHDNLHNCLKHFVLSQVLPRNVCDFVTVPRKKHSPQNDFYTEDEAKLMLEKVNNDRLMPVAYLGLLGLRRSEMLALTWSDIDMINNTITINKNLVYAHKQLVLGDCKTASSIRTISVPPSVIVKLKEYKLRQNKERMNMVGSYKNNDLVVCKSDGEYIIPSSLTVAFTAMLKKYGLRRIRLHDLRHTYCSLALNYYNIPATTVAKQAGHCNPKVTIGQYSHSNAELQKQSADVFENNLFAEVANKKTV